MFDYQVSKHPHFDEACRAFALRHNLVQLAERAGMNVQILRNKLNPAQPHLLTAPDIWLLTDLTEDSTLVDGFLAQIHCLPCVPINEVAKEKLPHYVMSATAEIGRVAAGAVRQSSDYLVGMFAAFRKAMHKAGLRWYGVRVGEAQRRMNAARASYARSLEVRDRIAGAGATTTAAGLAMGTPVMAAVKSYNAMSKGADIIDVMQRLGGVADRLDSLCWVSKRYLPLRQQ